MPNYEPINAVKYDSSKERNTHQFITIQAVNILSEDISKLTSDNKIIDNFNIIKENIEDLKKGCIAPDYGVVGVDRDYALYQDHFFDPDTEKNFTSLKTYPLPEIKDTAESQARNYFSRAIATWFDGDTKKSIYYLGKALHYFEDANEPHHCLNWTGGEGTAHTRFEYYAEEVKSKYAINNIDMNLYKQFENDKFINFISKMVFKHARMAKALEPYVSLKNTWADWDHAIKVAIGHAQEGASIVMYRFLQEISNPKEVEITNPIGKIHVIVKIGDVKNAGTDNSVYFGIKTKDEKDYHYLCDLAGNDFERNTTGCYQITLDEKIKFNEIKDMYIVKKGCKCLEDQAYLENVEVYMQGKRVKKSNVNKWIKNQQVIILE